MFKKYISVDNIQNIYEISNLLLSVSHNKFIELALQLSASITNTTVTRKTFINTITQTKQKYQPNIMLFLTFTHA